MTKRTKFRRRLAVTLTAGLLAAAMAAGVGQPASATHVVGEALISDTWLFADIDANGQSGNQGWSRLAAADFNNGGKPDCALATGRSPSSHTDTQVPTGIYVKGTNRTQIRHDIQAHYGGSTTEMTNDYTYWLHAAQDNTSDAQEICLHTSVTTDANGYFTVVFPRTLSSEPVAVNWSGSDGSPNGNLVISMNSAGFSGRAYNGTSGGGLNPPPAWRANKTFGIDYWVTSKAHPDTTYNDRLFEYVAGTASVTTDANGHATINHADLNSGLAESGQVTGGALTTDTSNVPGGVVLSGITPTQSTVHVREEDGTPLENTTMTLHYVINGGIGGSTRPQWGSYDFRQIPGDYLFEPECDGSENDLACFRWHETAATIFYELEGTLQTLIGDVDSQSWVTMSNAVRDSINNSDVTFPPFSRDTTPEGDEEFKLTADTITPEACGQAWLDFTPINDDGYNRITHTLVELNAPPLQFWSKDDDPENGKCNAEGVLGHEILHGFGYGHADDTQSIMSAGGGLLYGTIPFNQTDEDNMAAIYGNTSSAWAPGEPRLSTLAKSVPGQSVGLVTVTGLGGVVAGKGGMPMTQVRVGQADNWAGAGLPATVLFHGGTLGERWSPLPDALAAGHRWYVRVDDRTGRVLNAKPVAGGQLQLDPEYAAAAVDDVGDGGAKNRADVAKVRAKAGRYVKPTGPSTVARMAPR